MPADLRPLFLCGPTASGKSALALELATRLGGEIVNADAFQLYRGIETLSAAPAPADFARAPHHLFGVLDPRQPNNAHSFLQLALPLIAEIQARGHVPLVTGGASLYLKFLSHGPPPAPPPDPALRADLESRSLDDLARQYRQLDPAGAARADLANRRHLSRALEICILTGKPASLLRDEWLAGAARTEAGLRGVVIRRARPDLHALIANRCRHMLDHGAIDEVAKLPADTANTCLAAIGIREIRAFLTGKSDRATCLDQITAATRQYAKRQQSWFRRETWLTPVDWQFGESTATIAQRVAARFPDP